MTLALALVLLFLGVFAVLLVSIHRHKCPYCRKDAKPYMKIHRDQSYVDPRLVEIAKRYAERERS